MIGFPCDAPRTEAEGSRETTRPGQAGYVTDKRSAMRSWATSRPSGSTERAETSVAAILGRMPQRTIVTVDACFWTTPPKLLVDPVCAVCAVGQPAGTSVSVCVVASSTAFAVNAHGVSSARCQVGV